MKSRLLLLILITFTIMNALPNAGQAITWDRDVDLTNGLVAWYPLDGNTFDFSGNHSPAIMNGDVHYVNGHFNDQDGAMFFDGNSDWLYAFEDTEPHSAYSVATWVKFADHQGDNNIFQSGWIGATWTKYSLYYNDGATISTIIGTDSAPEALHTPFTITDEVWYHIASVYSGDAIKTFVDGVMIDSVSVSICPIGGGSYNNECRIGGHLSDGEAGLHGALDDIRIYDRALNPEEIELLYYGDTFQASFFADETNVPAGTEIQFYNTSTGMPDMCLWDFGDGNSSTEQNPTHTYTEDGTYDVTLTIYRDDMQDTCVEEGYITIEYDLEDGLVAWYPFNNGSLEDISGTGNDGDDFGTTSIVTNRFNQVNQALEFDGSTSKIYLGSDDSIDYLFSTDARDSSFSVSAWFNVYTLAYQFGGYPILHIGTNSPNWQFNLGLRDETYGGELYTGSHGMLPSNLTGDNSVSTNVWHHAIVTYSGETHTANLYLDGQIIDSGVYEGGGSDCEQDSVFIGYGKAWGSHFSGKIDDIRIYNRVLHQGEIALLYCSDSIAADFYADETTQYEHQEIQFHDASEGGPTSWQWDFGDGNSSTEQNPTHTYADEGTYDVTLTIYRDDIECTTTKQAYITIENSLEYGLVAWYPLDGDAEDASGNGHDGTVDGALPCEDRFRNTDSAYEFDGIDDIIEASNTPNLIDTCHTLCCWVSASGTDGFLVGKGENGINSSPYMLHAANSRYKYTVREAPNIIHTTMEQDDYNLITWYFLVGSYNGSQVSLYVNGVIVDSTISSGTALQNQSLNLTIGSASDNNGCFKGKIDDVRIYDRALSPDEITELYQGDTFDANFYTEDTTYPRQCEIQFYDTSQGAPTEWLWDFGDGTTSTEQHPTHSYDENGVYDVTLIVRRNDLEDYCFQRSYITIEDDLEYGLVAWYPFDGTTEDASGNFPDGTPYGIDYVAGHTGDSADYACRCNSTGDHVYIFDDSETYTGYSVSAWIKFDAHDGDNVIFTNNFRHTFQLYYNDGIEFNTIINYANDTEQQDAYRYTIDVVDDQWYHVTSVYTGSQLQLYLDGEMVGYQDTDLPVIGANTENNHCYIGGHLQSGDFYFHGAIDDVRIYERPLNSAEINRLFFGDQSYNLSFTASATEVTLGDAITFTPAVTAPITEYRWDFDSDGVIDSNDEEPVYTYATSGIKTITLTTVSEFDATATHTKEDYITVTGDFFTEDFDHDGNLPPGWTTNTRANWSAIQDDGSDYCVGVELSSPGETADCTLTSPVIDCSYYDYVSISYYNDYQDLLFQDNEGYGGFVEYSINGGEWEELIHYMAETVTGIETLLLPQASQQASLRLRFRYRKPQISQTDIWKIDDFMVLGGFTDDTPPTTITDLAAENIYANSVDLTWTPTIEDHFESYVIEYGIGDFGSVWSVGQDSTLAARTTSTTRVTGLETYGIYQFRIKAYDEYDHESGYSNTAIDTVDAEYWPPLITDPYPEQPSDWHNTNTVTIGCMIDDLGIGVDETTIEYRIDYNGNGAYDAIPEEEWTSEGIEFDNPDRGKRFFPSGNEYICRAEVTYSASTTDGDPLCFEWRAKDLFGTGPTYSGTSSEEGIADDWYVIKDITPPTQIPGLFGLALSNTEIGLFLGAESCDSFFDTYQIYYWNYENVDENSWLWDKEDDPGLGDPTVTYTTITGLEPNTNYYFRVRAIDMAGNTCELCDSIEVSTVGESSIPSAPENLSLQNAGNGVLLAWDQSPQADVDCYRIYRGLESGYLALQDSLMIDTRTPVPTHSFTDVDVVSGTTYFYHVTAVTTTGQESEPSDEYSIGYISLDIQADFTVDLQEITIGDTVHFTDMSHNGIPTGWEWDFQNDGTIDSYEQNPSWLYDATGTYSVSLTVTDANGTRSTRKSAMRATRSNPEVKEDYITVNPQIPVLAIDPDSLDFGDETTELTFTISNSGTGQLYWAADESEDWMSIAETSVRFVAASRDMRNSIGGSVASDDSTQVLVSIDRTYLIEGDYDGTISVTSNGGTQDINVHMEVVGNAPDAPTNLLAYPADSEISLTWDSNTEADLGEYRLYRDTTPDPSTLVAVIDASQRTVTYLDTLLTNGVTYHYHVTAVDVLGNESDPSNEATATPVEIPTYWFVSTTGTDGPDYGSQTEPFATIQYAIDTAVSGDTIQVADGVYHENINFNGKDLLLTSEYFVDEETSHIFNTIIDGGGNNRVASFVNGESSQAILNGLTLRNGNASYGGGIYCQNTNPTLSHLRVVGNYANYGGGIALIESDCQMIRLEMTGNQALHKGGGIYLDGSNPEMINCTIACNMCISGGGAYVKNSTDVTIINSIIFGNDQWQISFGSGGSISNIDVSYSLLDENDINTGANYGYIDSSNLLQTYPLFWNAKYKPYNGTPYSNGNFRLHSISACRDAGSPVLIYNDPDGTRNDMGAYYYDINTPESEFQSTLFVSENGSNTTGTGDFTNPYQTVQYSIDQIQSTMTDTIIVLHGTYEENLQIQNSVVLGSLYLIDPWEGHIDATIIDGGTPSDSLEASGIAILNPSTRTFNSIDVSILGLTIRHGIGWRTTQLIELPDVDPYIVHRLVGGGIYVNDCTPFINANKFIENGLSGTHEGGAVYTSIDEDAEDRRTRPQLVLNYQNNWFFDNYAQVGSSVASNSFNGTIDLSGSEFDVAATLSRDECGVSNYWCANDSLISYTFDDCSGRQEAYVTNMSIQPDTLAIVLSKVYGEPSNPVTINLSAGRASPGRTLRTAFPLQIPDYVSIIGSGASSTEINPDSGSAAMLLDHSSGVSIGSLAITQGSSEIGGGLYTRDSEFSLQDVEFNGNQANIGGALFMQGSTMIVSGIVLDGNEALEGFAGAIYVENSVVYIADATLRNNVANFINTSEDAFGSGIYAYNTDITIQNLVLEDNVLPGDNSKGAGIYLFNSEGVETDVLIENVDIRNNSASYGGGIYMVRVNPTIRNVLIADNGAFMQGGAIYAKDCFPEIVNCTIVNNSSGGAGGLFITGQGDTFPGIEIMNTILWGNDNDQIRLWSSEKRLNITFCDVMDGINGISYRPQDEVTYLNNIAQDPLFSDEIAQDYTLLGNSPCIDTGNPDPQYNDPDGSRNDIGAFYFTGLGVPANLVISVAESTVTITWQPVDSASSYKVYSCGTPDGNFTEDTTGTLNGTSWTAPMPRGDRYYHVKAVSGDRE